MRLLVVLVLFSGLLDALPAAPHRLLRLTCPQGGLQRELPKAAPCPSIGFALSAAPSSIH